MQKVAGFFLGLSFSAAVVSSFCFGAALFNGITKSRIAAGYIESEGKLYHVTPATVVPLQEKMEKLCGASEEGCSVQPR